MTAETDFFLNLIRRASGRDEKGVGTGPDRTAIVCVRRPFQDKIVFLHGHGGVFRGEKDNDGCAPAGSLGRRGAKRR